MPTSKRKMSDSIVCCFFCVNGIEYTQDAKAILRSLIFQILHKRPDLVRHVKPFLDFDAEGAKLFQNYESLWSIFKSIVCDEVLGSVTIVIDAVDECEKASRNRLMDSIAQFITRPLRLLCVKFCITSRPSVTILPFFRGHKPHRLGPEEIQSEIDKDLRRVIEERVGLRAEMSNVKQDTREDWERALTQTADRTFLWVKFILDIMDEELLSSPGEFDRILADIPRDLKTIYARFLQRIPPRNEHLAIRILKLLVASSRPLSVDEINMIVSLQEAASDANCRDLASVKQRYLRTNMEDDINRILGPLIRIEKSAVYLVHLSLKEFLCEAITEYPDMNLASQYRIEPKEAHLSLATTCMMYLALEDFSGDLFSMPRETHSSPTSSTCSPVDQKTIPEDQNDEELVEDDIGMFGNLLDEPEELDPRTCAALAADFIFFEYAATYWARHFAQGQELASAFQRNLALRLCDKANRQQCNNWFRFFWITCMEHLRYPADFDQTMLAAFFDHHTLLKGVPTRDVSHRESLTAALDWACMNGNNRSVNKLLATGIGPDSESPPH